MRSEVRELLVEQLRDAYSAEKQTLRCMQKVVRKASSPALREGIQMHIDETQTQIERVERAMERLEARRGRKVCEAMGGCSASSTTKSPLTERTLHWRKRSVNGK